MKMSFTCLSIQKSQNSNNELGVYIYLENLNNVWKIPTITLCSEDVNLEKNTFVSSLFGHNNYHIKDLNLTYDECCKDYISNQCVLIPMDKITDKSNWFEVSIKNTYMIRSVDDPLLTKTLGLSITLKNHIDSFKITAETTMKSSVNTFSKEFKIFYGEDSECDITVACLHGLQYLKDEYENTIYFLMPELFSLTQLQSVVELFSEKTFTKSNFRRMYEKKLIETNEVDRTTNFRPTKMYKYNYFL